MAKSGNDAMLVGLAIVAVVAYNVYRRWRESQQAAGSDTRVATAVTQRRATADRTPQLPVIYAGDGAVVQLVPLLVRTEDDREATVYVVKDCRALTLVAGETEAQQQVQETGAGSRRAAASAASAQRPTTASAARARTGRRPSSRSRSRKQSTGCCGPSKPKEAKATTANRRSRSTGTKRSQSRSKKAAKPAATGQKSRSRSRHAGTGQGRSRTARSGQSVRSGSEQSQPSVVAVEPVNVG